MSEWLPLSQPPTESGRYVVGHRGYAKVIHYFADDLAWPDNIKLGWHEDPKSFNATHYFFLPNIDSQINIGAGI